MQQRFPLTESLWAEWISDATASNSGNASPIIELFDKAVEDYLSITLWEQYIK